MALTANAKVEATPNFITNLAATHDFFQRQDAKSASSRVAKLKADLREMVVILSCSPDSGRPARFLAAKSAQARLKTEAMLQLAQQAYLPNLREFIVGQYIVLYANAESEVVLLALKHQRQLVYSIDAGYPR